MSKDTIEWFRLQRHYKCRVFLFSQTFDVDKKIRDLADEMFLVTKKMRIFSYAKRILRQTVLVEATGNAPSKIDENLIFDSLFFFWAGSRKLTFIPKWVKWFDSFGFDANKLKQREFELVPLRDDLIKKRSPLLFRKNPIVKAVDHDKCSTAFVMVHRIAMRCIPKSTYKIYMDYDM